MMRHNSTQITFLLIERKIINETHDLSTKRRITTICRNKNERKKYIRDHKNPLQPSLSISKIETHHLNHFSYKTEKIHKEKDIKS